MRYIFPSRHASRVGGRAFPICSSANRALVEGTRYDSAVAAAGPRNCYTQHVICSQQYARSSSTLVMPILTTHIVTGILFPVRDDARPLTKEGLIRLNNPKSDSLSMMILPEFIAVPASSAECLMVMLAFVADSRARSISKPAIADHRPIQSGLRVTAAVPALNNSAHGSGDS
nr:hypothetical protein CFP56_20974 [Quercus suber]